MGKSLWAHIFIATCLGSVVLHAEDDAESPSVQIVVSVADQKLALVKDGGLIKKFPISTSKFGLGDSMNSYKTPLGKLKVCDKIGQGLPLGAVMKSRNATGEILAANSPGRDPIVTRILWLDGEENGNANAKSRGIYIHGTVEENKLGQPVSYGCIRMRSVDVVELFDDTPEGTPVEIITEKLPKFRKPTVPKPELLASTDTVVTTRVGPHGLVVIKTVRNGADKPATVAAAAPIVAQTKPAPAPAALSKPAAPLVAAKTAPAAPVAPAPVAPAPKVAAAPAPPLPPVATGPTVVFNAPKVVTARLPVKFSTPAAAPAAPREGDATPAEPRVLLAMSGSILMSDLQPKPKAKPVPAPAPEPVAPMSVSEHLAAMPVTPASASKVVEEAPVSEPCLVLQVEEPVDLLTPPAHRAEAPLDELSAYLFNPPVAAPQFRIAFRAGVEQPEL